MSARELNTFQLNCKASCLFFIFLILEVSVVFDLIHLPRKMICFITLLEHVSLVYDLIQLARVIIFTLRDNSMIEK